eukprot:430142-Alexandrium_andersonii.AAC.1
MAASGQPWSKPEVDKLSCLLPLASLQKCVAGLEYQVWRYGAKSGRCVLAWSKATLREACWKAAR